MAETNKKAWFDAMLQVPPEWRAEFCRFAETGEASEQFLAFVTDNDQCRQALEKALRGDTSIAAFVKIACGSPGRSDLGT
jgi:hypothetical protein